MASVWAEKYRPHEFKDIIGQEEIIKRVEAMVNAGSIPHLLFSGPAGTGKTSLAMVVARKLYGDLWSDNMLELNSSDERGIDVVRNKIKDFARTMPFAGAAFKIILLDEADALTREAQQALRRTMERYTNTCRFILDCNYSSKIIDPIQSRCAVFRFKPLNEQQLSLYIHRIAGVEGIKLDSKALSALYYVAGGDCRRAANALQAAASLSKTITQEMIYDIASMASPEEIKSILMTALSGDFRKARADLFTLMIRYGLCGLDAIRQIQSLVWDLSIPDEKKILLVDKIGDYEFRMVEGADEFIQLEALLAQFYGAGKKS